MAEREGFEPSIGVKAYTPLAGERLQPARPSLRRRHIILELFSVSILVIRLIDLGFDVEETFKEYLE